MREAAARLDEVVASLRSARQLLQVHPDFAATTRAEAAAEGKGLREKLAALDGMTFAAWLDHCLASVLDDGPLAEAAGWLRDDLRDGRKSMEAFIEEERRDTVRFAKRRQRRQYQAAA